jgi:hypothetical protein
VIHITLIINIILCVGSLAWGYGQSGRESFALWILIFGAVWLIALWRRLAWFASVGLLASILAAALGLWLGLSPAWMLAGILFGLMAWDLTEFRRRLSLAFFEDDLVGLERRHLLRIYLLLLAALLLSSIALTARVKFSFEWGLLLAIVTALGITHLIRWLRNS